MKLASRTFPAHSAPCPLPLVPLVPFGHWFIYRVTQKPPIGELVLISRAREYNLLFRIWLIICRPANVSDSQTVQQASPSSPLPHCWQHKRSAWRRYLNILTLFYLDESGAALMSVSFFYALVFFVFLSQNASLLLCSFPFRFSLCRFCGNVVNKPGIVWRETGFCFCVSVSLLAVPLNWSININEMTAHRPN